MNLLQPQDRRSQNPGDSKETARARRRLAATGHADPVHQALGHVIRSRSQAGPVSLLDVGCGEGSFLRSLDGIPDLERHGLDLSAPSIDMAARASPEILFVVANADRFLPYADHSFDFLTSIDARASGDEFARVLSTRGLVLFAVPGPDDLMELRERIQGGKALKSRTARVEEALTKHFTLAEKILVRETRTFHAPVLRDLLSATYRGFRHSERAAVESLSTMSVTLSQEILAFQPR